jgi:hypothetical protein
MGSDCASTESVARGIGSYGVGSGAPNDHPFAATDSWSTASSKTSRADLSRGMAPSTRPAMVAAADVRPAASARDAARRNSETGKLL